MTVIETAQVKPPETDDPKPPKVKKRRIVEVKTLWSNGFIETQGDVEAFLGELRAELEAALAADERVQIK